MLTAHKTVISQKNTLVAGFLNKPGAKIPRTLNYKNLRLHASELIKADPAFKFCERELVIKHLLKPKIAFGKLPATFELLFSIGHALHDHVRNRWIHEHPEGWRAFGRWRCPCRHTQFNGILNPTKPAIVCERCQHPVNVYDEWELYDDNFKIVWHPDFNIVTGEAIKEDFVFNKERDPIKVYEIKGIDRKSVDFSTLDAPLGEHHLQGSFYWWAYYLQGYKLDDNIGYVYADRRLEKLFTEDAYKEFSKPPSKFQRIERYFDKAVTVNDSIATKSVPPRTVCDKADCQRAKNCSVSVYCFGLPADGYSLKAGPQRASKSRIFR